MKRIHTFDELLIQDFIYKVYYTTEFKTKELIITRLKEQLRDAEDELARIKEEYHAKNND